MSERTTAASTAEELLWQALSLTRGVWREIDALEVDLPEGTHHPMIGPLNELDERIFFALFAFVPGMYGEDEDAAIARDRHFHERFGDLPDRLELPEAPVDRVKSFLAEIRRRIGAATIRLDATDGEDGEIEAVDELEGALDAIAEARRELDRITQHTE